MRNKLRCCDIRHQELSISSFLLVDSRASENNTMSIGDNARQAARALDYQFKSDTRLIEALTAPGVEGEGSQGNRWLGDFGIDVIRSCLSFYAYEEKIRPSKESKTPQ